MTTKIQELVIEGVTYVPKGSEQPNADCVDNMQYVLIRGYGSGVQYGYLKSREGCEVSLINSRRIWSWNKATETSQIAVSGIDASTSKVTVSIPEKIITDAIEILFITKEGAANLQSQPVWKK
jgi:hypothetical protein